MKIIVIRFTLFVMVLFSVHVSAEWSQPELSYNLTPVEASIKAYPFELPNLDEETVRLSDYSGKVVMLNFWATWCPPCIREMPSMQRLYKKLEAKGFTVLAINQMENEDDVFAFTGQLELEPTFPILFDKKSKISNKYRVRGLPTTYLIDKKGYIRYRAVGGRLFDHEEVVKTINQLIDEK